MSWARIQNTGNNSWPSARLAHKLISTEGKLYLFGGNVNNMQREKDPSQSMIQREMYLLWGWDEQIRRV
jgi:hypothetical protein